MMRVDKRGFFQLACSGQTRKRVGELMKFENEVFLRKFSNSHVLGKRAQELMRVFSTLIPRQLNDNKSFDFRQR